MADPGWYADPLGHSEYRYFDGEHWTDQVSTGGNIGIDPPVEAAPLIPAEDHPPPPRPGTAAEKRPVWWLVAAGAVVAGLVVLALVLLAGGDDGDGESADDTPSSVTDDESDTPDDDEAVTTTTEAVTTTTQATSDGLTPEDEAACRFLLEQIDVPGGYDPNVVFPRVVAMATDGGELEAAANRALASFQETGSVQPTAAADLIVACGSVL